MPKAWLATISVLWYVGTREGLHLIGICCQDFQYPLHEPGLEDPC
jgi:hypothetical protein